MKYGVHARFNGDAQFAGVLRAALARFRDRNVGTTDYYAHLVRDFGGAAAGAPPRLRGGLLQMHMPSDAAEPCGMLLFSVRRHRRRKAVMVDLVVSRAEGAGKYLLRYLETVAGRQGVRYVVLHALPYKISYYRHLGYRFLDDPEPEWTTEAYRDLGRVPRFTEHQQAYDDPQFHAFLQKFGDDDATRDGITMVRRPGDAFPAERHPHWDVFDAATTSSRPRRRPSSVQVWTGPGGVQRFMARPRRV